MKLAGTKSRVAHPTAEGWARYPQTDVDRAALSAADAGAVLVYDGRALTVAPMPEDK